MGILKNAIDAFKMIRHSMECCELLWKDKAFYGMLRYDKDCCGIIKQAKIRVTSQKWDSKLALIGATLVQRILYQN